MSTNKVDYGFESQSTPEQPSKGLIGLVYVICAVCVIGGLWFAFHAKGTWDSTSETVAKLEAQAERDLADAQAVEDTASLDVNEVREQAASAEEAGQRVVDLLDELAQTDVDWDHTGEAFRNLFPGDRGARTSWYTSQEDVEWSWRFATTDEFQGHSMDVVWLAEDKADGALLAYALATYDVDTDSFSAWSCHVTRTGNQRIAVN